jgi:hypothetical protein
VRLDAGEDDAVPYADRVRLLAARTATEGGRDADDESH